MTGTTRTNLAGAAILAVTIAFVIIFCYFAHTLGTTPADGSSPSTYHEGQAFTQHNINTNTEWVRMPPPVAGTDPVWCVIAYASGYAGAAPSITCDWGNSDP